MPKRKPARPPDLRRAILDASLEMIEEGGVGSLSMREVARRARVTHGAPYYHFADRAAILAAIAEEGFAKLAAHMTREMESEAVGTVARFEAAGRAYVDFALQHSGYMRIMFRPELAHPADHPNVDEGASNAMKVLVECVHECQRAGTFPGGDATPIVLTAWAMVHGLASLWVDGPMPRLHPGADPRAMTRLLTATLGRLLESTKQSK